MSWVSFDQSTGNLSIAPPAYNQSQTMTVQLKSTITYASPDYATSNNPVYKTIILNVKAVECQIDN